MSPCPEFSTVLNALSFAGNATPSHEALLKKLPPTKEVHEWFLGTWSDLQQRGSCRFCQLVVLAVTESVQQTRKASVDSKQPVNILLFPDEASFRLSFPSPLSARLAFVANDASEAQTPDTARLLPQQGVDIPRIKTWLQICEESHESCSWRESMAGHKNRAVIHNDDEKFNLHGSDEDWRSYFSRNFKEEAMSNFRVIDVELGCIKQAPLDVRYVALSYVWGQSPTVQLRKGNFKMLTSEGALDAIRQQLPQTITDAIDLLKALCVRYLWIDGLCLIQDDSDDVSLGISMMNSIYHGSYFTIVAASGQDAHAGLAGIRQVCAYPERKQITAQLASGVQLAIIHSIDWHLNRSIYNQRGWTLQELVLSDRTLIFINRQVYFRCHEANWSEETWADKWTHWLDADDSNISRMPDPVEGFLPSCWTYQKLCEDFSRRKLRNGDDALRALEGVTHPTAAGMETPLVEGLPGYYLDHFLLFISATGHMRRRQQFASFSWAGWDGSKMWPRENFECPAANIDGTSANERQTENILRFLQYNHLVEWACVGLDSHVKELTVCKDSAPSLVLELMQEHPQVFANSLEDPVYISKLEAWPRFGGVGGSSSTPQWDNRSYEWNGETRVSLGAGFYKTKPLPEFCMEALDLANGQAEFDRLINRMTDVNTKLAMYNWIAVRQGRIQRRAQKVTVRDVYDYNHVNRNNEQRDHTRMQSKDAELPLKIEDRRPRSHRIWFETPEMWITGVPNADKTVPNFPPYTILYFATISLHLTLCLHARINPSTEQYSTSPFERIPGSILSGASGQVVGSLHPDNIHLLPRSGSAIELLLVARCHKPTVGSALTETYEKEGSKPMKLFWVMYVVWKNGIAKRRGIGQILQSALEDAVGNTPTAKSVLLG